MRTFYQHPHHKCPSMNQTNTSYMLQKNRIYSPGYISPSNTQSPNYFTSVNYHLLNQITDSQTQKNYYRTRLTEQYHTHHNQLQNTFATISEKNQFILELEEQLDRMSKDYRVLSDEYVGLKNSHQNQKQLHKTQMQVLKRNHQNEIKKIEDQIQSRTQKLINQRIQQIQTQCQKRVEMFKSQLQQARSSSTQLNHQYKLLKQDYHQVMVKNQTIIQESIHRQLRKRDFQAQNNYLRDVSQYGHIKKVNQQLKDQVSTYQEQILSSQEQNKRLRSSKIVLQTKLKDLQDAFQYEKSNNRVKLQQKYKETQQMQTNTEQGYVPIILPIQTNLVGQIQALKQFLSQKMISKYQQFFTKASLKQKKKSASLITFKNFLAQQIKNSAQNTLLMHVHTGLQRIVKLYCPAMMHSREYLTLKDQFVRKTVMQCQGLNNKQQKLFRLLQLINRLHHPITHVKSTVSTGQVKMVQIKILTTLKKIFLSH